MYHMRIYTFYILLYILVHRWPEFSVGRTWLYGYIGAARTLQFDIITLLLTAWAATYRPGDLLQPRRANVPVGRPTLYIRYILYKRGLFGTQPSKNRPPPRWVAGRSPVKWVTVSPAETGSPRVGGAPRNRITGSPRGGGGCHSVRGRFRGWTVRAQPLAAAAAIIDPFLCDLVRRRRYARRTHTNTQYYARRKDSETDLWRILREQDNYCNNTSVFRLQQYFTVSFHA